MEEQPHSPAGMAQTIRAIALHIEKYTGPIAKVLHESTPGHLDPDIYLVHHSEFFPYNALVTSGMSHQAMQVPPGMETQRYAELCLLLPAGWPLSPEALRDENNAWPLHWLKTLARLPHEHHSWIGYGHTVPNGENAAPFAPTTKMGCMLLLPTLSIDRGFGTLRINDEKTIRFYCLYALYKDEMLFRLRYGTEALVERLDELGLLSDVLDIHRENGCGRIDLDE